MEHDLLTEQPTRRSNRLQRKEESVLNTSEEGVYKPKTKETRAAYEGMLSVIQQQLDCNNAKLLMPFLFDFVKLQPDVVAHGVNILAAYPPYISPTKDDVDKRSAKYNILSGTSMACPHVAGAIAYLKTLHPDWSPSALKSAIMTTSRPLNASMHPDREFAYGAGNIDPRKAVNPGLVYDISKQDYTALLCSAYDNSTCSKITGEDSHCLNKAPLTDFNYPALTAMINGTKINVNFTRVVTNVGDPKSTYKAEVTADPNLKITVVPDTLSYNRLSEKNAFQVSITGSFPENEKILSSQLVWSDGSRSVRSPIVVYTTDF